MKDAVVSLSGILGQRGKGEGTGTAVKGVRCATEPCAMQRR